MSETVNVLKSLVSVSYFNRGKASQIFDRLKTEKELIVLKNNKPSAVIISPEEYERLVSIEEDYELLLEANKRLTDVNENSTASWTDVLKELEISEEEINATGDVEVEL